MYVALIFTPFNGNYHPTLKFVILFTNRIPRRLKQHGIEKEPMQSTVTFITDFKDRESLINSPPYVMSYSTRGFTVKDIKVFGSVVIFPSAFYHWRVSCL